MRSIPRWLSSTTALTPAAWPIATGPASATTRGPATTTASHAWTAAWTAAPQRPGPSFTPNWSEEGFAHQTIRQIVRVTTGGTLARIRLSNLYGTAPLTVTGATIARAASGAAVRKGTLRHLTLKRARTFAIPAGAELASNPVQLKLVPPDSVTVALVLAGPTYHALAQATGYRAEGDHQADAGAAAFTETTQSWYYLSGAGSDRRPAATLRHRRLRRLHHRRHGQHSRRQRPLPRPIGRAPGHAPTVYVDIAKRVVTTEAQVRRVLTPPRLESLPSPHWGQGEDVVHSENWLIDLSSDNEEEVLRRSQLCTLLGEGLPGLDDRERYCAIESIDQNHRKGENDQCR
ncbi:hypothetical protein [Actinomadura montaniterrae]|uniref:Uncharacterized protein n=1 Tax=Actinomadura montaniterrae TaxID=1803903 RepID=A0A6L3W2W1_9ACTN|nr:hypothetical protein [Actinomadura montaniterrae]KAB2384863.1 hypothetical protein F9B16_09550 [Actinomadura montaniterrae]